MNSKPAQNIERGGIEIPICSEFRLFSFGAGLVLIITFFCMFFLSDTWKYISDVFYRNIGNFQFSLLIIYFKGFLVLTIPAILSLIFFYLSSKSKIKIYRENLFLLLFLVFSCALIFILGIFFIDNTIGYQTIQNWNLQNRNHWIVGNVSCVGRGEDKLVFSGDEVNCKFNYIPEFIHPYSIALATYDNHTQSVLNYSLSNELTFTAPEYANYVYFELRDYDTVGNATYYSISVGYPYSFLSKESWEQNKRVFLNYVLTLIGLIFFTIPQFVIHLREIATR